MERETVAKLFLLNEKDEALMLRTGEYREHPEKAHKPDLPGGLVDPNESERDAVVRELYEEAGIVIDPSLVTIGYAETAFYAEESKSVSKLLYVARLDYTPEVTVSWEHEEYEWQPANLFLEKYELRPFYKNAVAYLINNQLI
jgi:8-oxo-dGTP diphosphatase